VANILPPSRPNAQTFFFFPVKRLTPQESPVTGRKEGETIALNSLDEKDLRFAKPLDPNQKTFGDHSLMHLLRRLRTFQSCLCVCAQLQPCTTINMKANRRSDWHLPRVQGPPQPAKLHPTWFSVASRKRETRLVEGRFPGT